MRLRVRPREASFYRLFAEAGENLVTGTRLLFDLLAAPPEERPPIAGQLKDAEHRGDEITHAILRQVNATFVTPFDREDIYRLASRVDDVMDYLEAAGDLVVLYGLNGLPTAFRTMSEKLCAAASTGSEALASLATPTGQHDYFVEANRLENDADQLYRTFLAELFSGSYDTLAVLKLKGVVDELENAADAFERVADMIETIAVKES